MSSRRRTLWLWITSGVVAIIFTVAVLVGWTLIFTRHYVMATELRLEDLGAGYWTLLTLGCLLLMTVIGTIVAFVIANVRKTIHMQQQTAFIDSVTHELRSPLASLMLAVDTIERRDLEGPIKTRFLRSMRSDLARLQGFIEHVLEAGRLEHGKRDLALEPVNLPELLAESVAEVSERCGKEAEQITQRVADELKEGAVAVDSVALRTIICNLLENAIKYSPQDRVEIAVSARCDGGDLLVEVSDRGIGIPQRQLRKVFQRFYRIDRDGKRRVRGTGLGLYVVAALTRRLGGSVAASSPGEDEGATFSVRLPLERQEARA